MVCTIPRKDRKHITRSFYSYTPASVIDGTGMQLSPFDVAIIGQIHLSADGVLLGYGCNQQVRTEHVLIGN